MNKPNTIKRFRSVLIIAICGALLFGSITLIEVMKSGTDDYYATGYWLCIPVNLLIEFAGLDSYPKKTLVNNPAFISTLAVFVNAMLGAMLFGLLAGVVKLIITGWSAPWKDGYEK